MKLIYIEQLRSSNDHLKELSKEGIESGTCIVAGSQTGGKGTCGRSFISEKGSLYMSIYYKPEKEHPPGFYTQSAALGVCRIADRLLKDKTDIKWVNDIYYKGRKLGGILTETAPGGIVIGIGLNLVMGKRLSSELPDTATAVSEYRKVKTPILRLARKTAKSVIKVIERENYLPEYKRRCADIGKMIEIKDENGDILRDIAADISEEGYLILKSGKIISSAASIIRNR